MKICLSKSIEIGKSNLQPDQHEWYNHLVSELKIITEEFWKRGKSWELLKQQDPDFDFLILHDLKRFAREFFSDNKTLYSSIDGKQNIKIPVQWCDIIINDYDWSDDAIMVLFFDSEEFDLIDSFGSQLLLKKENIAYPIMVDISPDNLGIRSYRYTL